MGKYFGLDIGFVDGVMGLGFTVCVYRHRRFAIALKPLSSFCSFHAPPCSLVLSLHPFVLPHCSSVLPHAPSMLLYCAPVLLWCSLQLVLSSFQNKISNPARIKPTVMANKNMPSMKATIKKPLGFVKSLIQNT